MNTVRVYKILEASGFTKDNAEGLVGELGQTTGQLATKEDLKPLATKDDLRAQQVEIFKQFIEVRKEMSAQVWKFFLGISALASIFKLIDLILKSRGVV